MDRKAWAAKTARQIAHYWGAPHFDLADHLEQTLNDLDQESVRSEALADRLEAMLHQVGHPDYSFTEFYESIKLIVWELRQPTPPERS